MCVFDDNPQPIAVAQAAQSLPALHRLSTQVDIGESTLPPNPYISFKYFDKYSHNAPKLINTVIMHLNWSSALYSASHNA